MTPLLVVTFLLRCPQIGDDNYLSITSTPNIPAQCILVGTRKVDSDEFSVTCCFFLRRSFALVIQAGVQWFHPGSLQPLSPGFK